jgi:hypothetical protein
MKLEYFKKFDLFKKSVSLTYNGREDYSSLVGIIMTVIYCMVMLAKLLVDM